MRRIREILGILTFAGLGALLWAGAWHLLATTPDAVGSDLKVLSTADRTSLVLGALAIAIALGSLLCGFLAIVGWDKLEKIAKHDVEESMRGTIQKLQLLMEGRITSMLGFAIGELSSEPDRLDATNPERMSEAVEHCKRGYELLDQAGDRRPRLMGLNNYVYYASILGEPSRGRPLLELAEELRRAGDEYGRPRLILTYIRAVLRYSKSKDQREEARMLAKEVLDGTLTSQERKEASFYLASLSLP